GESRGCGLRQPANSGATAMKRTDAARRGVILVTVLWSMALLSGLAMAAAITFRGFVGIMAIDRDSVRIDGLLSAGLEVAAGMAAGWDATPISGAEATVPLRSGAIRVRLADEGGRIDVGRAPVEMLTDLFASIGVPQPQMVAQQVVAFRDANTARASA